ncbi:MAG: phosphatidylserine/phosphatidylglycerophosphate/cardiolipin synthase family protein [Oscillospiraceae bacterium]|nr:phosphatidylserine/phosphatidylglycerophosphate/cardiolipin synthase family protein [Oscillospiraceae bacterium]
MKKNIKKIVNLLFSRLCLVFLMVSFQIILVLVAAFLLEEKFPIIVTGLNVIAAIMIINSKSTDAHKLAWFACVLLSRKFGSVLYLVVGSRNALQSKHIQSKKLHKHVLQNAKTDASLSLDAKQPRIIRYLSGNSFPAYNQTTTKYFPEADLVFNEMMKKLSEAQSYIFIESFILEEGYMWAEMLKVLEKKAESGVEVRILYDDIGCVKRLPFNYPKKLNKKGILCRSFNRVPLIIDSSISIRDHRKLVIIDGITAFINSFNICDEYINVKSSNLDHWKDNSIMITGTAVKSVVVMFLQMWNLRKASDHDFKKYIKTEVNSNSESSDLVQPFCCEPFSTTRIYENVYLNLLNSATKEVCIFTPYLVPSAGFLAACQDASKSGINIKIVYPQKADHWYTNILSKSYFPQLLKSGVKIYKYMSGFIHAKSMIVDDVWAVVGTANIDYRSFYSQFEIGVVMHKTEAVKQFSKDCKETLKQCSELTMENCVNDLGIKLANLFLKPFKPLF